MGFTSDACWFLLIKTLLIKNNKKREAALKNEAGGDEKHVFFLLGLTYSLLTKCEVKMAGYWPSSFFACLWTETKSRSIQIQIQYNNLFNHVNV